jgi:P27 family predicted phage terminase small subunit
LGFENLTENIMGKRGRQPKPSVLRVLEGNPGKRKINKTEPRPPVCVPECPEWVSADARKYWGEVSEMLHNLGVLTSADIIALALLVDALAQYIGAKEDIAQRGDTQVSESGYECPRPSVAIRNKSVETVVKILAHFGMTPSSRSSISIAKNKEPESPLVELMRRANERRTVS